MKALNQNVDVKYLKQFIEFREFLGISDKEDSTAKTVNNDVTDEEQTPQDIIASAMDKLNKELASNLLESILKMDCFKFEKLVNDLVVKMGYGKAEWNQNSTTQKSGDQGIDGIVKGDQLGFDSIYTQAKLWKTDSTVGRPEIQKFVGAMTGQGATKGLFITTSKFSSDAYDYAQKNLHVKVILVDGQKLAELMIEHELGATCSFVYKIKNIDNDYFTEE